MSGTYYTVNGDAPGGLAESTAAISEALATATQTVASQQLDAHQFIQDNGHDVVGGHPDVHGPAGRGGDRG